MNQPLITGALISGKTFNSFGWKIVVVVAVVDAVVVDPVKILELAKTRAQKPIKEASVPCGHNKQELHI